MQSSNLSPKKLLFNIDKEFLSIDFQALSLIQLALFSIPTYDVVIRLKKLFGIKYLTAQEILQELQYPHSPLRKYLYAIMMSLIIKSEILLEENFQRMLNRLIKEKEKKLIEELIEIEERNHGKPSIHDVKAKLIILEKLAVAALQKIEPNILPLVMIYALEGHRSNLLTFYLKYADAKLAPVVVDMVDSHINILTLGYQKYEKISQRQNLTPLQRKKLDEWLERRINRIQALTPENIEKILPHLPLHDPVSLKQHLFHVLTNDYIDIIDLEKIKNVKIHHEDESESAQLGSEQKNVNDSMIAQLVLPEQKQIMQFKVFQNNLNDLFTDIFDKHEGILIYEVPSIIAFLDMLMKVVQNKNITPSFLAKVKLTAFELTETLSEVEDVDYSSLIECIYLMYGEEFALMHRYIAAILPEKIFLSETNVPSIEMNTSEEKQQLATEDNKETMKGIVAPPEESLEENHKTTPTQEFTTSDITKSIINPAKLLILEFLKLEQPRELQESLIQILELLKESVVTQEIADKITNTYNHIKTHFPMFDTSEILFKELSKLPFIAADKLKEDKTDDFSF